MSFLSSETFFCLFPLLLNYFHSEYPLRFPKPRIKSKKNPKLVLEWPIKIYFLTFNRCKYNHRFFKQIFYSIDNFQIFGRKASWFSTDELKIVYSIKNLFEKSMVIFAVIKS